MNMRRLQGWALIVSAALSLLYLIPSNSPILKALLIIGSLLLIAGLPAVELTQRAGVVDWIGIILIELGAVIALILNIMSMSSGGNAGMALPLTSALSGGVGRVIVGWLTTRKQVFSSWVGWAFLIEGILNFVGGLVEVDFLAGFLGVVVPLVGAAALFGYGWRIVRHES